MTTDSLDLIRRRRAAIAEQIEQLSAQVDALRAELPELETTERVLARLSGEVEATASTYSALLDMMPGGITGKPRLGDTMPGITGKPPNTPTTPSMILSLLREAQRQGKRGLEPRDMLILITRRWWPTVKSEDVAPTAWRMWKDGRLDKDGPVYMLHKATSAEATTSSSKEETGAVGAPVSQ